MKSKFLDRLLAAVASKDEAQIKAIALQARDAEEEEEEKKDKEEADSKDKARDQKIVDGLKSITDSLPGMIAKAVSDCMKEMSDKAKDEAEAKEKEEAEAKKKAEDKAKDEAEEKEVEEEEPKAAKAKDSASLEEVFGAVKSAAEIIAPGVQFPTFDRAADPRKTFRDCICGLRRRALTQALGDAQTAAIVTAVQGKTIDTAGIVSLSCRDTRVLFNGTVAAKKAQNAAASTMSAAKTGKTGDQKNPMDVFMAGVSAKYGQKK